MSKSLIKPAGPATITPDIKPASLIRLTPATRFQRFWKASANGAFQVSGKSKQVVLARLAAALEAHERHCVSRTYRLLPTGGVFVLYYRQGWAYDIFTAEHESANTCMLSTPSYTEALAMMEDHWRSYAEDAGISSSGSTQDVEDYHYGEL